MLLCNTGARTHLCASSAASSRPDDTQFVWLPAIQTISVNFDRKQFCNWLERMLRDGRSLFEPKENPALWKKFWLSKRRCEDDDLKPSHNIRALKLQVGKNLPTYPNLDLAISDLFKSNSRHTVRKELTISWWPRRRVPGKMPWTETWRLFCRPSVVSSKHSSCPVPVLEDIFFLLIFVFPISSLHVQQTWRKNNCPSGLSKWLSELPLRFWILLVGYHFCWLTNLWVQWWAATSSSQPRRYCAAIAPPPKKTLCENRQKCFWLSSDNLSEPKFALDWTRGATVHLFRPSSCSSGKFKSFRAPTLNSPCGTLQNTNTLTLLDPVCSQNPDPDFATELLNTVDQEVILCSNVSSRSAYLNFTLIICSEKEDTQID